LWFFISQKHGCPVPQIHPTSLFPVGEVRQTKACLRCPEQRSSTFLHAPLCTVTACRLSLRLSLAMEDPDWMTLREAGERHWKCSADVRPPWWILRQMNHSTCRLLRLPNELIYMILELIDNASYRLATRICLGQTCHRFRLLLGQPSSRSLLELYQGQGDVNPSLWSLVPLLQKDQFCAQCLFRYEHYRDEGLAWKFCKFQSWSDDYCGGCESLHPLRAFLHYTGWRA
jgi:hypothetical protein